MLMLLICAACKGIDADAAAGHEMALHLKIARLHQIPQIIEDDVYTVFVKIAVVAEAEQIQLQALAFHHALARNIGDINGGKIRLPRNRAKTRKFWTVELNKIVIFRVLIQKRFQHAGIIICWILSVLVAKKGNALFQFSRYISH